MYDILPRIHALKTELSAFSSLHPSPRVNQCFGCLVSLVTETPYAAHTALKDSEDFSALTEKLQSLCAQGETLLEAHWAEYFLSLPKLNVEDLAQFPYMENYNVLTEREVAVLRAYTMAHTVTFVGGGPLPLTAIILAATYGYRVTVLDRDARAAKLSRLLLEKLGLSDRVTILLEDVHTFVPGTDAVILGALVGASDMEKKDILTRLAATMRPGSFILVRGVEGLAQLLYPPVPDVSTLTRRGRVPGDAVAINTIELFEVPERVPASI